MYRTYLTIIILCAGIMTFTSCKRPRVKGSGPEKTEQFTSLGEFDKIIIEAPVDATINIVSGSQSSVSLTGYANLIPFVKMKVEGRVLHIYREKEAWIRTDKDLQATITMPSIVGIDISGGRNVIVHGTVGGDKFDVEVAGSGTVEVDSVNVNNMHFEVAGSGDITVKSGFAKTIHHEIAGSGEVHTDGMNSENAKVEIAGSGTVDVMASQKLDIDIAGSGEVNYKGHPVISKSIAGSGDITDKN